MPRDWSKGIFEPAGTSARDAHRLAWTLLGAVLLSGVPVAAAAGQYFGRNKVQYEDFDFRVLHTPHFDVHFYVDEAPVIRDMARQAERWHARLTPLFDHRLGERKPIILYGSHADFQQTNVTPGLIGEGTGGFTDALRNRVVMPLTATYADNEHVLGHELVHVYQYDVASAPGGPGFEAMGQLPLWLIEGMAEYLTLGREHPHTAMWLRDDVLHGRRPTIEQLTRDARFFPYRYGHALWAFVGGRWGDAAIPRLYRAALKQGFERAIPEVLGVSPEQLSRMWMDATYDLYLPLLHGRTPPREIGAPVVVEDDDAAAMNVSPAVSPDGRYVAFFSGRGLFGVDLYLADARTGEIVEQLTTTERDPHFEALSFTETAGTWSPDGRRFAFVVYAKGDQAIAVLDLESRRIERRIRVDGVDAMANPAWSPDGGSLAFSGSQGGLSDLYVHDLRRGTTRRLTNDRHADIQPSWSPDGRTLAFATDRGREGDLARLSFAPLRLALLDLATARVEPLEAFAGAKHINPQFSPDGRDLYFIADREGFSDIYRRELATGRTFQVTRLATGVSGITDNAVAMSVARQTGHVLFSVFERNGYNIYALAPDRARGVPVAEPTTAVAAAGVLPPAIAFGEGVVAAYLREPAAGLVAATDFTVTDYRPSLKLDYLGPPTLGVTVDHFGTSIGGGVAAYFGDLLGDRAVGVALQTGRGLKDVGGQLQFENLEHRWNWGVTAGWVPHLTGESTVQGVDVDAGDHTVPGTLVEHFLQRVYVGEASFVTKYPFSRTRRVETSAGYQRIQYDLDVERLVAVGEQVVTQETVNLPAPPGLDFFRASVALVGDNSFFGTTSPVQGGRYRLEVAPTFGDLRFQTLLADYRRYLFAPPVTLAVRGLHYGRYGADAESERLPPLFLGSPAFVRGYDAASFDAAECAAVAGDVTSCPAVDRVVGSRLAVANLELRIPLLGPGALAIVDAPFLPVEVTPFLDAGVAWTADEAPELRFDRSSLARVPVFSTGVATRINLLGYAVIELYYAYPLQRRDAGWRFGFQLAPGW